MKTLDEAAQAIIGPGGLDSYKDVLASVNVSAPALSAILGIVGMSGSDMAQAVFKGVSLGICIGIEMEKRDE